MEKSSLGEKSQSFILLINVKNCWHFNIYKQDKFQAQLTDEPEKSFVTSMPV